MRKKRIKKTFTLIEVIIAFFLFSLVTTSLFNIFLLMSRSEKALLRAQGKTENLIFFHMRMKALFSRLIKKEKKKGGFFFTLAETSPTLVFSFKERTDKDPYFGSKIIGRLLVLDNTLVLLSWPFPPKKELPKKMRREVLLENVQAVEYSFFGKAQNQEAKPHFEEVSTWKKDAPTYPLRVRLQITFADETQTSFWFLLPQGMQEIVYHS